MAWLADARIDRARELLETSTEPAENIGRPTGLGYPASVRAALHRRLGLSPQDYRALFRRHALSITPAAATTMSTTKMAHVLGQTGGPVGPQGQIISGAAKTAPRVMDHQRSAPARTCRRTPTTTITTGIVARKLNWPSTRIGIAQAEIRTLRGTALGPRAVWLVVVVMTQPS
jgi:hypothetical protein